MVSGPCKTLSKASQHRLWPEVRWHNGRVMLNWIYRNSRQSKLALSRVHMWALVNEVIILRFCSMEFLVH
jgi:hypothetical protein